MTPAGTVARPWRAVAYSRLGGWRQVEGRVAGATWPGIARWVRAQRAAGRHVVVWEVKPVPGTEPT